MAVDVKRLKFPMHIGEVFRIEVADGSQFSEKWAKQPLYRIINRKSGVIEGEAFSLARAMLQCRASELSIDRLQQEHLYDEELISMESMFSEMDVDNGDPEIKH